MRSRQLPVCWPRHVHGRCSGTWPRHKRRSSSLRSGRSRARRNDGDKIRLIGADFFDMDWKHLIAELPEPVLLLGNPPWVTNSHLATLGSQNLPVKSNFQNRNGLDAITGKANFDISEWMLIRLMEAMIGRLGRSPCCCKSAVARKVLCHAWKNSLPVEKSAVYPRIDAAMHFNASVDAVLLVTHFRPSADGRVAAVHPQLNDSSTETTIGHEDGLLLSNVVAYRRWRHLTGKEWKISGTRASSMIAQRSWSCGGKERNIAMGWATLSS